MIDLIKYIILGIIQGITEPIPVSSSGHVFLFKKLFNTTLFDSLNFEIISNFGSFLAILFIFRKDIKALLVSFFSYIFKKEERKKHLANFKYCWYVVIGTIPVGITGIIFKDYMDRYSLNLLAVSFIVTSISLYIVRNMKGTKEDKDITFLDAFLIGLLQAVTILPGVSRSGIVLVGCLLCSLKRDTALKYTFMLYFPVTIGTMILGVPDLIATPGISSMIIPYIAGMIAAMIVTFFSYQWLSNMVKNGKLWKFSIYCLLLAAFIFVYFN